MGVIDELAGRTPRKLNRDPFTGVVTKVDAAGAWVAREGEDRRDPVGPCLGPKPPVGTRVLVVRTDGGDWIAAVQP